MEQKKSVFGNGLLMLILAIGVVSYFIIQIILYFTNPFSTTLAYTYQAEEVLEVSGCVVRAEEVLSDEGGDLMRIQRSEGERVSAGGEIAVVYEDQTSLNRQAEITTLTERIEQLRFAKESMLSAEVSAQLDSQIFQNLTQYRFAVASNRMDLAEKQGAELRTMILKRNYIPSNLSAIEDDIAVAESSLADLNIQAESDVRRIVAPSSGLYSAITDGYENILTPDSVRNMTPSTFNSISPDKVSQSGLGKLILGNTWYYAAVLSAEDAYALERKADSHKGFSLRFNRGAERTFPVILESLSAEEDGKILALFSARDYLSEMTLLRRQNAQIISNTVEGIRVPKAALRIVTEEIEIKEESTESAEKTDGTVITDTPEIETPQLIEDNSTNGEMPESDTAVNTLNLKTTIEDDSTNGEMPESDTAVIATVEENTSKSETEKNDNDKTDENKKVITNKKLGVYCVIGTQAVLKPVEILYTGDNFFLVRSTAKEDQERRRLRVGDEMIVQSKNLYDGKVVTLRN